MAQSLVALSFICVTLLVVFIPLTRVRYNVANLAIVLWLALCNLIHGINTIVWSNNVNMSIPVWCDIVTRLLMGARIAVPGACLCIAAHLEFVSSKRMMTSGPAAIRTRAMIEGVFCYIIPVFYMAYHYIVQDHRFDLINDFGCSPSVHPSTTASLIIWIPPLLVCILAIIVCGVIIHHSFRIPSAVISYRVSERSNMSSSLFFRRLTVISLLVVVQAVIIVFSMFSIPILSPWTSWSSVHAFVTKINIVKSSDVITEIQSEWWSFFAISVIYIIFSYCLGEEPRDIFRWMRGHIVKFMKRPRNRFELPKFRPIQEQTSMTSTSPAPSLSKPKLQPLNIELKSGWDDMLDVKPSKGSQGKTKTSLSPLLNPSDDSTTLKDDVFMSNTLAYLGSPTAQSLGISTPVLPPAVHITPRAAEFESSPNKLSSLQDSATYRLGSKLAPPRCVPIDASSTISSFIDAPWPVPPSTPPTPVSSRRMDNSPSNSSSLSVDDTQNVSLYPNIIPPGVQLIPPFEGSSISSMSEISPTLETSSPKKSLPRRPSLKGLQRSFSKERSGLSSTNPEIIYMTVVKETV